MNELKEKINPLDYTLLALVSIIIVVIPFYRGLFFRENYLPAVIVTSLLFLLMSALMIYKRLRIFENFMDIAILGLVTAYFISFIFGISKMDSLDGLLKYAAAFMFYKIAYHAAKNSKLRQWLLNVLIFSGFLISLVSMLGSADIVKINGIFGWGQRLNGLYQYPNATAAVLSAVFLLNIIMILNIKNKHVKALYIVSAATIFLTFMETRSRGGMLSMMAAWLLALILLRGRDRLKLILYSALCGILAFAAYNKVYDTFISKSGFLSIYALFVLASAAFGYLAVLLEKYLERINERYIGKTLMGIFAVAVVAVIAAFNITMPLQLSNALPISEYQIFQIKPASSYIATINAESGNGIDSRMAVSIDSIDGARVKTNIYNNQLEINEDKDMQIEFNTLETTSYIVLNIGVGTQGNDIQVDKFTIKEKSTGQLIENVKLNYRFIPDDIAKKINEISLKTESSSERLVFVKDGIEMFKDYMFVGTGAKGWRILYPKYQSYRYSSNEAHNYYLQTAIESGVLGIVSVIALLVIITAASYKVYRKDEANRNIIISVFIATFALLAHALIDFDLSYYAILLLLFALLGLLSSFTNQQEVMTIKSGRTNISTYIGAVLAVVVLLVSSSNYSGLIDGDRGAKLMDTDIGKAKEYIEKSIKKDFYNPNNIVNYNQLLAYEGEKDKDKSKITNAYENYLNLERIDPYKVKYYQTMLSFYLKHGYLDEANGIMDRAIELQPLDPQNYESKVSIGTNIMSIFMKNKDYKKALEYCTNIINTEEHYINVNKRVLTPFELTEKTKSLISNAKELKPELEQKTK
ncbi:MAG TPA: O-antigen ligase family protein [Clostridia bacterium]|nr:O-antigen ligase family protein [Clostridia bacterium]